MLDDADGGDLVVAGPGGEVAEVAVLHPAAVPEAVLGDARGRPLGLGPREGHAVGAHAVVPGGPHGEAAPAAADVEQRLAGGETELPADEVELVGLGLLELTVGIAIVGAGVDHERVEEQRVEIVPDVVVVGDRLRVASCRPRAHVSSSSRIPKIEPNTTRRRAAAEPRTSRTDALTTASGRPATRRRSQPASPSP